MECSFGVGPSLTDNFEPKTLACDRASRKVNKGMRIKWVRRQIPVGIILVLMLLGLAFFRRATVLPDPPSLRVGMTWEEATAEIHNDFHSGGGGPNGGWLLTYSVGNVWGEVLSVWVFFDREYRVTGWRYEKFVLRDRPTPGDAWYGPIRRLLRF
jgi:hypothetical protein